MSDVELLCHAIHICGEDQLTQDHSYLKSISFQKLAQVNQCYHNILHGYFQRLQLLIHFIKKFTIFTQFYSIHVKTHGEL